MQPIISIRNLSKIYPSGFQALRKVNLDITRGEIFALLGRNGAGKTTLINIICGIVNLSTGSILANGYNVITEFRAARGAIGLVPQELFTDGFENVWNTVSFSRGLFGRMPDPTYIERLLRDLSLWDKKDSRIQSLSGGMKRRVMIAKALSHEPDILFLDEPTAGVDVELRKDMWEMVRRLRDRGVTIILTTHYIEEAQEMADRVGFILGGEIVLVEDKHALMKRLGQRHLILTLKTTLATVPDSLKGWPVHLTNAGFTLIYTYKESAGAADIAGLLRRIDQVGIEFSDIKSSESSLEEIFVSLVSKS